jgi:hypothetical protein
MFEANPDNFRFEIEHIGNDVDENGEVEITIRHDDRFVEYVMKELDINEFNENTLKAVLIKALSELCKTETLTIGEQQA